MLKKLLYDLKLLVNIIPTSASIVPILLKLFEIKETLYYNGYESKFDAILIQYIINSPCINKLNKYKIEKSLKYGLLSKISNITRQFYVEKSFC